MAVERSENFSVTTSLGYKRELKEHFQQLQVQPYNMEEPEMDKLVNEIGKDLLEVMKKLEKLYNSHVASRNEEAEEYISNMVKYTYDELDEAYADVMRLTVKDDDGKIFV